MTWYYGGKFDKKRLRREMIDVSSRRPEFTDLWHIIVRAGDVDDLELARLAMADIMEEEGYAVMARCLRDYTYCKGEKRKRKRRR